MKLVDLLVELHHIHDMGHPSKCCSRVEEGHGKLPFPVEGVDKHDVPREGHQEVVHDVRVFQINNVVPNVVAGVKHQFSASVELNCFGRLVHSVCSF